MTITPGSTVTITLNQVPAEPKYRKTLQRLMRMQFSVQRVLTRIATARGRDNVVQQRGGRMWTARMKATKVVNLSKGASFSLFVTPQIVPDIKSVSKFVTVK
jgi:hypothetical protein